MTILEPADVQMAAEQVLAFVEPRADQDWSIPAGDLDWDCNRTLNHLTNAVQAYAGNLALRSTERRALVRDPDLSTPIETVVNALRASAAVLRRLADAAGPDVRGCHVAGMADASGFGAMGCDEILIHGHDIAAGFGIPFAPDPELCARVITRLFPWAEPGEDPWATLLWCNGRAPLGDLPRQAAWGWWCRPISEWDGKVNVLW
jgi:uncharacterized protein (TIGR03083 family)